MGRGMSDEVSNLVVQALSRGLPRNEISNVVGMSKRSITRVSTNLRKHGTPRAPPTGIKLGRPGKMNTAQAQAMLDWVARHDYTFYVKDLVRFLREHHDYRGCEGTARRSLVKAGYKRKTPWHKSEITVWVPPEIPPSVASIAESDQPNGHPSPQEAPTQAMSQGPELHEVPEVNEDIDPALSDPSSSRMLQHPEPESFTENMDAGQQPIPTSSSPPPPRHSDQAASPPRKKARIDNDKNEALEQQVTSLQDQVYQQQTLIMQLHRQLEESRQPSAETPPSQQQHLSSNESELPQIANQIEQHSHREPINSQYQAPHDVPLEDRNPQAQE